MPFIGEIIKMIMPIEADRDKAKSLARVVARLGAIFDLIRIEKVEPTLRRIRNKVKI